MEPQDIQPDEVLLTEYLNEDTLQQIQDAFSAVAGEPVRLCAPDGEPLVPMARSQRQWQDALSQGTAPVIRMPGDGAGKGETLEAPVLLDDGPAGLVRLQTPESRGKDQLEDYYPNLLRLLAGVLSRLCGASVQLRSRVEQLLAMHRVTAEISGGGELQQILDTVTATVVEALKGRAAGLRLLSEDGRELLIQSVCNMSPEYLNKGPILLSESEVDQEVIRTGRPVAILDLANDPRVLYPAESRQEGLVSGLCAPMIYKGKAEGVLRVYMGEWHVFDWFETQLLATLANAAAAAIVHGRMRQTAQESWEIRRQVAMAGEVQRRMIPDRAPALAGFDIAAEYVPSQDLSGDFYDFVNLPPDNLGVAVCDVMGKGVRASLLMASIRASLRAHAMNVYDMEQVLTLVNRDLCSDSLQSDFATMVYSVLDTETRRLTYSCAGHMPPILVRSGEVCHLETAGGVLGLEPDMEYPIDHVMLEPGDVVLTYTDGLIEAMNFADEEYGVERVERALVFAISQGYSAENICRYVLWDMRRFAGLHQRQDDTTLVVIRATEEAAAPPRSQFSVHSPQ